MEEVTEQKTKSTEDKVFNSFTDGINLVASLFSEETVVFRDKIKDVKLGLHKYIEQIPNKDEENEEVVLQMEEISSLIDTIITNLQVSLEESVRILTGALQISQKVNPDSNKTEE